MDERRTNTREQIRAVALEMFAERGYPGTSLREIAERLGVTKAAVYYHFKTKEDILTSLLSDFVAQIDELIAWAEAQPRTPATRRAVLERYADMLSGRMSELARFMQEGRSAIKELLAGLEIHKRFARLAHTLTPPDGTVEDELRAQVALFALHFAAFDTKVHTGEGGEAPAPDRGALRAAGARIAAELIAAVPDPDGNDQES